MSISLGRFLDEEISPERKAFNETARRIAATAKRVEASLKAGDLEGAESSLAKMADFREPLTQSKEKLASRIDSFDLLGYMGEGFHSELVEACQKEGIHIEGHFPSYEVFPFTVEVQADQKLALVNKTKVHSLLPTVLAKAIKKERDFLYKVPFNADKFLQALAKCYDLFVADLCKTKDVKSDEATIFLKDVYKIMTLLPQKDYPERLFAFDLHRLLKADRTEHNGRVLELGSVSPGHMRKAIRVVDAMGTERLYGTIQFRRKQ
jgi:hypothetical protein